MVEKALSSQINESLLCVKDKNIKVVKAGKAKEEEEEKERKGGCIQ